MLLANLACSIFGHQFLVHAKPKEEWAKGIRWIRCRRCGRDFVIHDGVKVLLPMDFELLDMHEWVAAGKDSA